MKKKKSKKGVIPRQTSVPRPPKVGAGKPPSGKLNWSKVGRRRLNDDDCIQELAGSLKKLREEKGITVTQVAKELGVAPATLIKFEDRSYPVSIKVVIAMAERVGYVLDLKPAKVSKKK